MNQFNLSLGDAQENQSLPTHQHIVKIALATYIDGLYSYYLPEIIPEGSIVKIPLAGRTCYGVVWEQTLADDAISPRKLKEISHHYATLPPYSPNLRHFITQLAAYNCVPLGQALKLALPLSPDVLVQQPKRSRPPKITEAKQPRPKQLTPEQAEIAARLSAMHGFQVALLDGATGSGKTEVFFAFAQSLIAQGKQILLLVPEIALSLQLVERATNCFGFAPTLWHSSQTPARRRDAMLAITNGSAKLIIGARSALFLPYANLGGIIVDEEHEPSLKQDENASYHARDMAVLRAKCENIPIVLASATPSLESLANVNSHKYQHFKLHRRNSQAALPQVHLLNLKRDKPPPLRWIAPTLQARLSANLEAKQQSLLFLNRKGYAPLVICKSCGHHYECPSCSAWLVYHSKRKILACHHCGFNAPPPPACPNCGSNDAHLTMCGSGVERIEEEVRTLFPTAKIGLLSGEQSKTPTALQQTLGEIASGEIDIIIGTQIIAKGHHFPHLSLVGVIDADAGLNNGDIRASERTYQLLHQIAGRAGRESLRGEVILQTSQPEHALMQALKNWDREAFISLEMQNRRLTNMPPYGRVAALIIEGKQESQVQQAAKTLERAAPTIKNLRIIGANNAPIYKLRNQYRMRFLIIAPKNLPIQQILLSWREAAKLSSGVKCKIDIDAVNFY